MTLDFKDLKKQLKKEGFNYIEQIKSGGFATTLLVKEGIFSSKKRCAKIFIDGDTDANHNEFKIMEKLYSIAPDKFPQPFKFLELNIKSSTYNDVFHKVNVIIMELLDPLVIPSDADADFWKKFLTDLTESLVLMHQIEHNHKDIKPGNILMKNGRFVFIDFGITVVNDVTLKSTGSCCCTAYFASPETLEGKLSKRGDIYSLGATARALI